MIPADHDTILCHPDEAERIRREVPGISQHMNLVPCRELEPGQVFTMREPRMLEPLPPPVFDEPLPFSALTWRGIRIPSMPSGYLMKTIVHPLGPVFVPESKFQRNARLDCGDYLGRHASWREARPFLRRLLDPGYRHPRAKTRRPPQPNP